MEKRENKRKKKNVRAWIPYDLRPMAVNVYLLVMACIFPFVMDDKLFNVTVTRFQFWVASAVVLSMILIALSLWHPLKKDYINGFVGSTALKLFFIVCVISTVLSGDWIGSFWGAQCRYMGCLFYLIAIVIYLVMKRFYLESKLFLVAMALAGTIVIGLGILNHGGVDPFGILDGIAAAYKSDYLSTIGQMNFFSEYVLLVLAVSCAGLFSAKAHAKYIWGCVIFVCGAGIFVGKSDGALLGLSVGFGLLPLFFRKMPRKECWICYFETLACFGCGFLTVALWTRFGNAEFMTMKGIYKNFLEYWGLLFVTPTVSLLLFIWGRASKISDKHLRKVTGCFYAIMVTIVIVTMVTMVLLCNLPLIHGESIPFYKFFHFSETWGTDRGRVWIEAIKIFHNGTILEKIFGFGPASTASLFVINTDFDNVHNELLQYLLTVGMAGLVCYLIFFMSTVVRSIKSKSSVVKGAGLMLVMYGANSLVSVAQPLTTPYLFLAAGIVAAGAIRERKI
ncbi:MAG: hypothetical protein ACI4C1_06365 [Lachnospiraceae bacterium]